VERRGGRQVTWDNVRLAIAWSFVVIFFAASTLFIVIAFYNYYYASNLTQYVANFVSRFVG